MRSTIIALFALTVSPFILFAPYGCSSDDSGAGGAAGASQSCDSKTMPGCVGVTCVGGKWVCPEDAGGDGGCDPGKEPGCIGVTCVSGQWVCPEDAGGDV